MIPTIFSKLPRWLLCFVYGAIVPAAFSPYDISVIAIVSLSLLFSQWKKCTPVTGFYCGLFFGLGMFGVGVNWLHISINTFGGVSLAGSLILTFILVLYLSLYPAITGYLACRFFNGRKIPYMLLYLPALWTLSEWSRGWIFTGFPWLNLGYSQIDMPIKGLAPVLGIYGVSWGVAMTAGMLALVPGTMLRNKILISVTAVTLWSLAWVFSNYDWTYSTRENVSVVLVQGNIPQELKWQPEYRQVSLDRYHNLTNNYWHSNLIIWPETAIPAFYYQVKDYIKSLHKIIKENNSEMLIGLPVKGSNSYTYFNSVILLDDAISLYHKRHLVPFGEYLPLKSLLGNVVNFLHIPMSDFTPGQANSPLLKGDSTNIGISICYEDTFGEEVIKALPTADVLVNVSNDAWFGDSAAPHQHLQMARMRAIETGRYMLRATNNGVSAIINEKGRIISQSPQFTAVALPGEIKLFQGMTPYARFGNYLIVPGMLLLLALIKLKSS